MRGFTILELLITLAIIAIFAAVAGINLLSFQRSATLESAARDIVGNLRLAQGKAMAGADGNGDGQRDAWGIRFTNDANDRYEMFYGNTYNAGAVTTTLYLPSGTAFTDPAESGNKDVIFTKRTGTTTPAVIIVAASDNSQSRTITLGVSTISSAACPGTVYDADFATNGISYAAVAIGSQCWMAENLNRGTMIAGTGNQTNNSTVEKYCYKDSSPYYDTANCDAYGGMYQWSEAMNYSTTEGAQGICPTGWHIPTDSEQYALENYLKDTGQTCVASRTGAWDCDTAGAKLKSGGSSGFNAPWGGYR
ncbi:MAG: FISUMP domain-containing protein, partial [Patescibacteria group bacterium]